MGNECDVNVTGPSILIRRLDRFLCYVVLIPFGTAFQSDLPEAGPIEDKITSRKGFGVISSFLAGNCLMFPH